jgi:3-hydroxy-9,10-secoandrosta-1,3,5(10)-triene-9,17-dione monooxygenase reductase component
LALTPVDVAVAIGRIPAGVAIITTVQDGRPHGATGMMWAESPDPPLALTTLKLAGATRRLITAQATFGISLLTARSAHLTWQFARTGAGDRFAGVSVSHGPVHGIPLLDDALATFECELEAVYPFGRHEIVVGRIVSARADGNPDAGPAIHLGGRLWQLSGTP